jgi:DNA polymerase III alpha subunit
MDIAQYVLSKCADQNELQRAGQELLEYQNRNLFGMLCYLKYLVDQARENNVVLGVGRGSSVASFVLFVLGVHRVHSLRHNLDFAEFMR